MNNTFIITIVLFGTDYILKWVNVYYRCAELFMLSVAKYPKARKLQFTWDWCLKTSHLHISLWLEPFYFLCAFSLLSTKLLIPPCQVGDDSSSNDNPDADTDGSRSAQELLWLDQFLSSLQHQSKISSVTLNPLITTYTKVRYLRIYICIYIYTYTPQIPVC